MDGAWGTAMVASEMAVCDYITANTSVWWDIENCPVPKDADAYATAGNITSTLQNMNYRGPLSISAYGDCDSILLRIQKALNSTGISLNHVPPRKDASDKNGITINLLFRCDLAQEVWRQTEYSPLFVETAPSDSIATNLWSCLTSHKTLSSATHEDEFLWPWLLWRLWKSRNDFIFQRTTTSVDWIIAKARVDMHEWKESHLKVTSPKQSSSRLDHDKWMAPPSPFLKCNIDAAWQDLLNVCGVSWILRDHTGRVRLYGRKTYPKLLSPLDTEATALIWAVNCIWNMGYEKVIFESDSLSLLDALKHPEKWPRLASYTTEIQGIISRRPWELDFQHISRSKNQAADTLAKNALLSLSYFGCIDNFIHTWLQPSLDV